MGDLLCVGSGECLCLHGLAVVAESEVFVECLLMRAFEVMWCSDLVRSRKVGAAADMKRLAAWTGLDWLALQTCVAPTGSLVQKHSRRIRELSQ